MKSLFAVVALLVACGCVTATNEAAPPAANGSADQTWTEEAPALDDQPAAAPAGRFARPPPSVWADKGAPSEKPVPRPGRVDVPGRSAPIDEAGDTQAPTFEPSGSKSGAAIGRSGSADVSTPPFGSREAAGTASGPVAERRSAVAKPQAEDRPGLGTTWGESRYSSVTEVPFERDGSQPTYQATVHYNDERGASALVGRNYGEYAISAAVSLGGALSLSLRDDAGRQLRAYRGNGRTVAIGEHGQRYAILVRNNTNERFEVVLSVDGLDVLDGREAGYAKRGYLVEAYGTIEVDGFRQSQDEVAAFRFGSVRDSYAAQTGSARNVGVIGAAAFGERGYAARLRAYQDRIYALRQNGIEVERRQNADPFPNRYAIPPLQLAH
jgi:hypothetical protein